MKCACACACALIVMVALVDKGQEHSQRNLLIHKDKFSFFFTMVIEEQVT